MAQEGESVWKAFRDASESDFGGSAKILFQGILFSNAKTRNA